jgi:hypothetical protein
MKEALASNTPKTKNLSVLPNPYEMKRAVELPLGQVSRD